MSIIRFIKDVGRGAAGARALDRVQAREVMGAVLDGQVTDIELGAFVLAMRMKGETLDELCGFLDAVQERCTVLRCSGPVVIIPSYNGARRLLNLTPLLAMELAAAGARVLVHGPLRDPARVTSAEVFHDLGLMTVNDQADLDAVWQRREPAFMSTATLCSPLQRLLDVRWQVGVRNSGHTVAKMLNPFGGARCLRLVSFTHPEFGALMGQWAQRERVDAMLLRGTEGEAVADARRQPRIDAFTQGLPCDVGSVPAQVGTVTELPLLPRENDASTTALYIQAVLGGERPTPAPLARQVQAVLATLALLDAPVAAQGMREAG